LESFIRVCGISAKDLQSENSPANQVFKSLLEKRLITPKTLEIIISSFILDDCSQADDIRHFLGNPALESQGLCLKIANWENTVYRCLAEKNLPSLMKGFDTMVNFIRIDEYAVLYSRMSEKALHNQVITVEDFGLFSNKLLVSGVFSVRLLFY
jgi:hypothetical protein